MISVEESVLAAPEPIARERGFASEQQQVFGPDTSARDSPSPNKGNSCFPATKTSKRYVDEDSKSPEYRSDSWRMANFKVVPCSKRYAHDWTICPFAHPGEKARRRDPRLFSYAGIACPEMKKAGFCTRGDKCPYAHNVFEFWLHPTRYRTQLCNDGQNCSRHVCFFAHSLEEMRASPNKPVDGKKDISPDNPFMHPGNSLMSGSSTASSEVWSMLTPEDRGRSSGLLHDDMMTMKANSTPVHGLLENIANNLANVKLAMAGDKRTEVINMLTQLLHEAKEEKSREGDGRGRNGGHSREMELSLALKALDQSKGQALLGSNQRGYLGTPADSRLQQAIQEMLESQADLPVSSSLSRLNPTGNPLFTAPAAMDTSVVPQTPSDARQLSGGLGLPTSRMSSTDIAVPSYTQQRGSFWQQQQGGVPDLTGFPRGPTSNFARRMSSDCEACASQFSTLALLEGARFGGKVQPSANPSALKTQTFQLEDNTPCKAQYPRREVRRPPISAFQSAASQEWKHPPGRLNAPDLKWANSGQRVPSTDLASINEALTPPQFSNSDMFSQGSQMDTTVTFPFMTSSDRSKSTGLNNLENGLNILPSPLAFPTTQPGGRDTSALHSAPYDLALAYGKDARQGVQDRPSCDRSAQLQGWGGMNAYHFASGGI